MKRLVATLAAVLMTATLAAGCGGNGSDDDSADRQRITDLITEVNRVTADRDAKGFCAVIAPSAIKQTFQTRARCARETGAILKQAGDQPPLEIDSIDVLGDRAKITFKDRNGEAVVVREKGRWYVPLDSGEDTAVESDTGPESGSTGPESGS